MKRIALIAAFLLCAAALRGQTVQPLLMLNAGPALSNSAPNAGTPVISTFDGGASTNETGTITTTGTGNLLVLLLTDWVSTASDLDGLHTPTTAAGTFLTTNACEWTTTQTFTVWWIPSTTAGATSITVLQHSKNSAIVFEISGMNTVSPKDFCVSAQTAISLSPYLSNVLTASQGTVAIGWSMNGTSSTPAYVAQDVWSTVSTITNINGGNRALSASYIKNGFGQFTWRATGNNVATRSGMILLKTAIAGTAPAGNLPSSLTDFETGVDGDLVAAATFTGTTHGEPMTWTLVGTPAKYKISTNANAQMTSLNKNTVNGTTYPGTGTRGVIFDSSEANIYGNGALVTTLASPASIGIWIHTPTANENIPYSIMAVNSAGAVDAGVINFTNGVFLLEGKGGNQSAGNIPVSTDTSYWCTLQFNPGGTHQMACYGTNGAQVGSTLTCASTGSANVNNFTIGQSHAGTGAGGATHSYYLDNAVIDVSGAFPLLP